MDKKQIKILIGIACIALVAGIGAGFLYAKQTHPKLERETLEIQLNEQLEQEAGKLIE